MMMALRSVVMKKSENTMQRRSCGDILGLCSRYCYEMLLCMD